MKEWFKKYAAVFIFTLIASASLHVVTDVMTVEIKHTIVDLPPYNAKEITAVDSTAGGSLVK